MLVDQIRCHCHVLQNALHEPSQKISAMQEVHRQLTLRHQQGNVNEFKG